MADEQQSRGRAVFDPGQLRLNNSWEAFLDDVWLTLDKFKVPAEEQTELRAIVNSTRSDIVVSSTLEAEVA